MKMLLYFPVKIKNYRYVNFGHIDMLKNLHQIWGNLESTIFTVFLQNVNYPYFLAEIWGQYLYLHKDAILIVTRVEYGSKDKK